MAKNQSQRPGRDVRGGKGKSSARPAGGKQAYGKGKPAKGGYQRSGRAEQGERKPVRRGSQPGTAAGSWIEGRRAVAEALEVGMPLKKALVNDVDGSLAPLVRELEQAGVPVERVPRVRLDSLSSHGAHQGIVVQAESFRYAELSDVLARAGEGDALVVLLDHVTDQGNLGAIVRSAEVVGAAGVVIAKARAAGVGVGAFKTSAGAVLHLPIAQVSNLAAAIETLKQHGFWVGGSTEHAHDSVWEAPMGGRLCLVMGSEGSGISRLVLDRCDFTCKLPQRGHVESLNVAQAATVMCYEWLRRTSGVREPSAAGARKGFDKVATSDVSFTKNAADGQSEAPVMTLVDTTSFTEGAAAGQNETSATSQPSDLSFMEDAAAARDIDWDL